MRSMPAHWRTHLLLIVALFAMPVYAQMPEYVHLEKIWGSYALLPQLFIQPHGQFHSSCDCTPPTDIYGKWNRLNDSTLRLSFEQRSNHLHYSALSTENYRGNKDTFYLKFRSVHGKPMQVEIKPEYGAAGDYTSDQQGLVAVPRDSFLLFGQKIKIRDVHSGQSFAYSDITLGDSQSNGAVYTLDKPSLQKKITYLLVKRSNGSYEIWDAACRTRLAGLKEANVKTEQQ